MEFEESYGKVIPIKNQDLENRKLDRNKIYKNMLESAYLNETLIIKKIFYGIMLDNWDDKKII